MASFSFVRQMGLTHAEFFRLLPAAVQPHSYVVNNNQVTIDWQGAKISITLGAQQVRRIALLEIPFADVSFEFSGIEERQKDEFMRRFDLYFQRGGG